MSGRPCIFGEVLFDHFPDGRQVLGGAPFNVAWHLQAFGAHPFLISRVGADAEGGAVQNAMSEWGMDRTGLDTDESLSTGMVRVSIKNDEPSYDIVKPVAWDAIRVPNQRLDMAMFYHGTLALRSMESRRSCQVMRAHAKAGNAPVFMDVNLRPPWWNRMDILDAFPGADWVKLNGEELDHLETGGGDPESRACAMMERYGFKGILLTNGAEGASLLTADGLRYATQPRADVAVVDTVGAGDAMTSVIILGLLNSWDLQQCLDRAQEFASAIVGRRGATVNEPGFYERFIHEWSLGTFGGQG